MAWRREAGKWVLLVWLGVWAGGARMAVGRGTDSAPPDGRHVLPTGNNSFDPYPYYVINPALNPYAGTSAADRDAWLWVLAAQQVRSRPAAARPSAATAARPAGAPGTMMVPGGGAAGYFNRGFPTSGGPSRVRHNRYSGHIGR